MRVSMGTQTSSQAQLVWFACAGDIMSNLTHLPRHEFVAGVGLGIAKCPYDPADNSTALWVEHGNPGDLPGLYSGTNAEFTKADTVIFLSLRAVFQSTTIFPADVAPTRTPAGCSNSIIS
uniref:Sema domain-containing protein n=1 Tax=Timema tahoe TaxID=61484 RepID=A0A7R9NV89_9NEOP|nr:unnamed protein product [Timema tahoe]